MGSTGSGSFTDYSKKQPTSPEENNGGSSGIDKCGTAFSASLEEVSRCVYFKNNGSVPPIGTAVIISFNGKRLVVETNLGVEIGYLPTKFNYIKLCIEDNINYNGVISSSKTIPTPSASVDIVPI